MTSLLNALDAAVATANPFTAGAVAGILACLLGGICLFYAGWRVLSFEPPENVDEARRDEALTAILRTSHANPPMSQPAVKGFTNDDAVVERRHLENVVRIGERRVH